MRSATALFYVAAAGKDGNIGRHDRADPQESVE